MSPIKKFFSLFSRLVLKFTIQYTSLNLILWMQVLIIDKICLEQIKFVNTSFWRRIENKYEGNVCRKCDILTTLQYKFSFLIDRNSFLYL